MKKWTENVLHSLLYGVGKWSEEIYYAKCFIIYLYTFYHIEFFNVIMIIKNNIYAFLIIGVNKNKNNKF